MIISNVRGGTVKIGGYRLKRNRQMSVKPNQITPRVQKLINKGYLRVAPAVAASQIAVNSEPDEDLPDTLPAPEVPPPEVVVPQEPVDTVEIKAELPAEEKVEKVEEKPKIRRGRRKKADPK